MPFEVQYAPEAIADIGPLRAFDQRRIVDGIEQHLVHEPKRVSKSRIKAMTQPFWSQFRLRIDEFRVYYDVYEDRSVVSVLRVLKKTTGQTEQKP